MDVVEARQPWHSLRARTQHAVKRIKVSSAPDLSVVQFLIREYNPHILTDRSTYQLKAGEHFVLRALHHFLDETWQLSHLTQSTTEAEQRQGVGELRELVEGHTTQHTHGRQQAQVAQSLVASARKWATVELSSDLVKRPDFLNGCWCAVRAEVGNQAAQLHETVLAVDPEVSQSHLTADAAGVVLIELGLVVLEGVGDVELVTCLSTHDLVQIQLKALLGEALTTTRELAHELVNLVVGHTPGTHHVLNDVAGFVTVQVSRRCDTTACLQTCALNVASSNAFSKRPIIPHLLKLVSELAGQGPALLQCRATRPLLADTAWRVSSAVVTKASGAYGVAGLLVNTHAVKASFQTVNVGTNVCIGAVHNSTLWVAGADLSRHLTHETVA
ncbi:hypothetical protein D3C76_846710 [compost metagenome]